MGSTPNRKVIHESIETDRNQKKLFESLDHFVLRKTPDDGTFEPVSYQVPLKHPAAFTMMVNNKYQTQPKLLYSICHCLPEPNTYDGSAAPDGTIEIKENPILKGETLIESLDELRQLVSELKSKPLFGRLHIHYSRRSPGLGYDTVRFWDDMFVVVVDTKHQYIQEKLDRYLDEAMECMQHGRNFCIKIDFEYNITRSVAKYLEPKEFGGSCTITDGFAIYLTNHSKPACELCLDKSVICLCFLCWIFGGPCYYCYRKSIVKDKEHVFEDIPVKFVSQNGVLEMITPDINTHHMHLKA